MERAWRDIAGAIRSNTRSDISRRIPVVTVRSEKCELLRDETGAGIFE
jgi:hypothetical protein